MRWTASLSRPTEDGSTERAYCEASAAKGNAEAIARLVPPPFPDQFVHVFAWWRELNAARPESMHGIAALTYPHVEAWATLTGRTPTPHEVELLFQLDATFRAEVQ